jgi:hypothetical protein
LLLPYIAVEYYNRRLIDMSDNELRRHLVKMLSEPNAHLTFEKAIEYVPPQLRGILMEGYGHTAWQILEHLRISQWDILEFSRDAGHVSPKFPDGYWPEEPSPPDDKSWDESVGRFQSDLKQMCDLISEESNDLFEGSAVAGQTQFLSYRPAGHAQIRC